MGNLKAYKEYFKYVMEHKKNVFKVCWKNGEYIHAFTHDLSKFLPGEFIPYAKWFYGFHGVKTHPSALLIPEVKEDHCRLKSNMEKAWKKHYKRNKHHWNHYVSDDGVARYMPSKYTYQMICDWEAMSIKFGGSAAEYYMKNYDKITLNRGSRLNLEMRLGLIRWSDGYSITWKELCEKKGVTMESDLKSLGYIK